MSLTHADGRPKIAPVQGYSPGIPWSLHLEAYDAYRKLYGAQAAMIDIEDRGCRGGFGARELDVFVPGWRDRVGEIAALRARIAELEAAGDRATPDLDPARIKELIQDGEGFWSTCSGCHESEDGHDVGYYPFSEVFNCKLGGGCSDCGGIGAIWDNTDYEKMTDEMLEEDARGSELIDRIMVAVNDPGSIVGYRGWRSLSEWQRDAVQAVLSAPSEAPRT